MRKRGFWIVVAILIGGLGLLGYRALRQATLDRNLMTAVRTGDPQQVKTLLAQGANANARSDISRSSAWQIFLRKLFHRNAPEAEYYPLTEALMSQPGASRLEIVRLLLEHHANPNIRLLNGMPAIWQAGMVEDNALLGLLLDHGADPDAADKTGSSLLMASFEMRHSAAVPILLAHGADPNRANADGDTPLLWAAGQGEATALDQLLARGADLNHQNNLGQTALLYALIGTDPKRRVALLLKAGADVNMPDKQGGTPFLYALSINSAAAALMLTKGGDVHRAFSGTVAAKNCFLNVNMRMEYASSMQGYGVNVSPGTTPLMLAVRNRDVAMIKAILEKGAQINARDASGKTALDYVDLSEDIASLLRRAGARP